MDRVTNLASERAVVVFTLSSCCMCHTVTQLLADLSVNVLVHELDSDPRGKEMERALLKMRGSRGPPAVPAVFIGGRYIGGTNEVMSLHLGGELVPMLKRAGALWL
ncbi:putative glutaredoxin-C14 [Phragmites australis]|uniref:putative glutaredoxin-C14 n=1 Tax=Phragmites australis TaxID=29695 RepID=UPI002D79E8AE|nr:putative glutaredoxin-C14 [Phragmites australis]